MTRTYWILAGLLVAAPPLRADDTADLLKREIIGPRLSQVQTQEYLETRVPRMPKVAGAAEWQKEADRIRAGVLQQVVYRGAAAAWRDANLGVVYQETVEGGPGYRIKKLRYEALPGLWVPALLYEPEKLDGKVPAGLAVNGHDGNGKAAPYKQIRCINMAKRGMVVLNVEWLGMGQLRAENYRHGRMNQLDLCGTSGLAPFYLCMKRGLDVLLSHKNADPRRVAVSGLSGGGWQTIIISSLDTRVTLANPVAGYSSFLTRIRHFKDLGDSEQTPNDLATVADYTHLTALMAPRPTLLTYCAKDDCCFEAGYALPPLMQTAGPVFKLLGKENNLRSHVNHDPGTHNFERDNRQALYRMLGDHFFKDDPNFKADEIPSEKEVKTAEQLAVALPEKNHNFNSLARSLSVKLPREPELNARTSADAKAWQTRRREKLRGILNARTYKVEATKGGEAKMGNVRATFWKLKMDAWTVPAVELVRGEPKGTTILVNDAGRAADPVNAERLLKAGQRVLAVDPFYFGESKVASHDYLFALLLASVGDRSLGIQAGQVAAVARWATAEFQSGPVALVAVGPRSSTFALAAAGLDDAVGSLELHGALCSLKEVIEQNRSVEQWPELFCFGLLEEFDIKQLVALAAPRPVTFGGAGDRAKKELAGLGTWYRLFGKEFDPVR